MKKISKIRNFISVFLIAPCLIGMSLHATAQSIKGQLVQQQHQQQIERELRAQELQQQLRLEKAQLNLNELLTLVKSKDLESINLILKDKGWERISSKNNMSEHFAEDLCSMSLSVSWSFDKEYDYIEESYVASGWITLDYLTKGENAVSYQMVGMKHVNSLEKQLVNSGYKNDISTAINKGYESIYRNDTYEVSIRRKTGSDEYPESSHYITYVYNFRQTEERKQREAQYRSAISKAETAFFSSNYKLAKQAYTEAIQLKPEKRDELQPKIIDADIMIICMEAKTLVKDKCYEKAKEKYNEALKITPNKRIRDINDEIKKIDEILAFLQERKVTQYDYEDLQFLDYLSVKNKVEKDMNEALISREGNLPRTEVEITCCIDTSGKISSRFAPVGDEQLNAIISKLSRDIQLKLCYLHDYTVNAIARFTYVVECNKAIISVKKTSDGLKSKHEDFHIFKSDISTFLGYDAPYAIYTFDLIKTNINNRSYDLDKLVKMKNTDGGVNALLSVLVPGLGDHRVSHSNRKGIGMAVSTYGLIGTGIGLKYYSINQYKKYHEAITQDDMDKFYENANFSNQLFYTCVISAGIIWISDVIWVAVKGAKNTKNAKLYKNAHLGAYYDPKAKAPGVNCSLIF